MSFHQLLKRLREAANGQRGMGEKCSVNLYDLREILLDYDRLDDAFRAAEHELDHLRKQTSDRHWQPIETAPTEIHSVVLIHTPSENDEQGFVGEAFLGRDSLWYWAGSEVGYHDPIIGSNMAPTHWMKMPEIPQSLFSKEDPATNYDYTLYTGISAGRVPGGIELTLFIDSDEDCTPRSIRIGEYGIDSMLKSLKFFGYYLPPSQQKPNGYRIQIDADGSIHLLDDSSKTAIQVEEPMIIRYFTDLLRSSAQSSLENDSV